MSPDAPQGTSIRAAFNTESLATEWPHLDVVLAPGQPPRLLTVEGMWDRVEPYFGDYGITRVAHLTHLDRVGIPVHMAMKPAGRILSSGSGKGVTEASSAVSAAMEAIEQTYWEQSRPEIRIAPQRELSAGDEPFAPLIAVPTIQHQLMSDDLPIAWLPMCDIISGEDVWTPAETVYLPTARERPRLGHALASSNGLASGSHVLDATLSAVMEVIERDSITLAGLSSDLQPALLDGAGMPLVTELTEELDRAKVSFVLSDITTDDVGVPTVQATIVDPAERDGVFVGYGTSLDVEVAAVRAITEAAQSRCIVIAGARDDIFDMQRRSALRLADDALPKPARTSVDRSEFPTRSTGSLHGDIDLAIDHLRRAGFDRVLLHGYSAPGDPVQVVRVVVPGLEGANFAHAQLGSRALDRRAAVSA